MISITLSIQFLYFKKPVSVLPDAEGNESDWLVSAKDQEVGGY